MSDLKICVLVGGVLDQSRRIAVERGEKPRVDVLEMQTRWGASLFDLSHLQFSGRTGGLRDRLLKLLRRIFGGSALLPVVLASDILKHDVIYATGEDVGVPTAILLRLLGKKKPKLVLRMEQYTFGRTAFRRFIYRQIFGFAMRRVDRVLCRTLVHLDYITRNFQRAGFSAELLYEPVDVIFNTDGQPVDREAFQVIPAGGFIVSAGLEMRDYETLIRAIEGLPIKLVIGAGSPWSKFGFGPRYADVPANVTVQSFSPRQMRELYRAARFVVVPVKPTTRSCGISVILEAWAMKRCVLASRTEGLTSYVEDQVDGIFHTPGDVDDLREKIQALLDNPELAARLGENGQAKARQQMKLEQFLERVYQALENAARAAA